MIKNVEQFVKPRTGIVDVLPDNERQKIADDFADTVDSLLLIHARHVETTDYTRFSNTSSLMLTYPLENDRRLHIVVSSAQITADSSVSKKEVYIRETDSFNRTYRSHNYRLQPVNPDVVRSDFYASAEDLLEPVEDIWDEEDFDDFDSFDEFDETPDEAMERELEEFAEFRSSEFVENILVTAKFEEQIGINHLPADAEEIAKLREILLRAEFIHR